METLPVPDWVLILVFFILLLISAYFSSSETAMMKLNPYRMRALVRRGHGGARRAYKLLMHKDRLLAVILIGNNLVNFTAAVVANALFVGWFGLEIGGIVTTISLTLIFLIFAETAPKTIAALKPESIAYPSAYILVPLQSISSFLVTFINYCAAVLVRPFTRDLEDDDSDLSEEELRGLFTQGRKLPRNRRLMILNILNLEEQTVGDIMQPRDAIEGIDLAEDIESIKRRIAESSHTRLPVYRESVNDIEGILHMRDANRLLQDPNATKAELISTLATPYFTPSQVTLSRQMYNFKQQRQRLGIAVDEYGVVVGLVTSDDIVEEIVGEFTTDPDEVEPGEIEQIENGAYRVAGNTLLHEINQVAKWTLPEDGPRSVNGWLLAHLRRVPDGPITVAMDNYRVEVHTVSESSIDSATIEHIPMDDDFELEEESTATKSETTEPDE